MQGFGLMTSSYLPPYSSVLAHMNADAVGDFSTAPLCRRIGAMPIEQGSGTLEQAGLVHGSLCGPTMSDDGEVVWGQATMSGPKRFFILSIKRVEAICPELVFSDNALYSRLGELEADEVVSISAIYPQVKATKWAALGVAAVWLFESEDGENRSLSYEFDTGGRNDWSSGKATWSVLWPRR